MTPPKGQSILALLAFLALSAIVATGGSLATIRFVGDWYADAQKAPWNPPDAVFGPVWTVLYALMAVAAWLVWRHRDHDGGRPALVLYGVQLALNAAWTPTFFAGYPVLGATALWLALAIIVLLDIAVFVTMVSFVKVHRWAGWLLLPYLAWVLFATTLNLAVAVLNP